MWKILDVRKKPKKNEPASGARAMTESPTETRPGHSLALSNADQYPQADKTEQCHQIDKEETVTDQWRRETEESPAILVNLEDLESNDIVIAIIGPTGAGKSTFTRFASGIETHGVGHTLKPFTSQIIPIRFWDKESRRHVVLVDTPGFDTTFNSDRVILNMISDWLSASYTNGKLLSGILYFHRITDNRMAIAPTKNLRAFRELCGGRDALGNVHLITTMWDEIDPEVGERRLNELRMDYWEAMTAQGALIARCRSDDDSPKKFIGRLLAHGGPRTSETHVGSRCSSPRTNVEKRPPTDKEHANADRGAEESFMKMQPLPLEDKEDPQIVRGLLQVAKGPMKMEDPKTEDIVIAIMGPTGAGKSTFIRSASGIETQGIGHSLEPVTNQITTIKFWDQESRRHIVLVDTPGFDVTLSDRAILTMISNWLHSSYNKKKLLSGILYFHRITDNRMAIAPMRNFRAFRELCGRDALAKVHLITTMWDEVDSGVGERRLGELRTDYWKEMIGQGARIDRCRNDEDSPKDLLRQILGQEDARRLLFLQEEMCDIRETAAGQQLFSQLETLVDKQTELLRRIEKERKGALDAILFEGLQNEYDELRAQIDGTSRQMQELKLSRSKNLFRFLLRKQE